MVAFRASTGYISRVRDATARLAGLTCTLVVDWQFHWRPNGVANPATDGFGRSRPVGFADTRARATVRKRPRAASESRGVASLIDQSRHRRHGRIVERCDTARESTL